MKNQFREHITNLFKDFYFLEHTNLPVLVGKLHPQLMEEMDYFTHTCSLIKSKPLYFLKNHCNVGMNKFQVTVPTHILEDSFIFAFLIHLGEYYINLTTSANLEDMSRRVRVRKNQNHFDAYDFWINFIETDCVNDWHTHAGHLSGVIYAENGVNLPTLFEDNTSFNGQRGDIIIFPSNLQHSVSHNNSTSTRITYAFNLELI